MSRSDESGIAERVYWSLRGKWMSMRRWRHWLAAKRDFPAVERIDMASFRIDLESALAMLDRAKVAREEDSLPCKADMLEMQCVHLVKTATGIRVWPPFTHTYCFFKLRHHLFGYRAPSQPDNAGRHPMMRLRPNPPAKVS